MFFWKKKPKKKGLRRDAGFPSVSGTKYTDFLVEYHQLTSPEVYLEIGTQTGKSLKAASGACVSVDPEYALSYEIMGSKSSLFLYQGTSDDFFASNYLESVGLEIEFAFLDGMHLFEYLLRDFINTEKASTPSAAITMHDCVPANMAMTNRDWDPSVTKQWTGDVWKMLPILQEYRPDLRVEVLDCRPTGLVFVSRLDPESTVLSDNYDAILKSYLTMTLGGFGVDRFTSGYALIDSNIVLARAAE